ncbi:hypothetical protein [Streptomyces mutabilis]|uniref:hypothetical protein n=1 Tax=Streptomyces mutabilis TaxID=67332 RepID=UPI003985890E
MQGGHRPDVRRHRQDSEEARRRPSGCRDCAARARADKYLTETVLLNDPARDEKWAQLTPLALWMDVMVESEQLSFDLDEQRAKMSDN